MKGCGAALVPGSLLPVIWPSSSRLGRMAAQTRRQEMAFYTIWQSGRDWRRPPETHNQRGESRAFHFDEYDLLRPGDTSPIRPKFLLTV